MPALASANTGTTTNADHGCSLCSSHSTTDAESCAWRDSLAALPTVGSRASSSTSTNPVAIRGVTGASIPNATPVSVVWTFAWYSDNQHATPNSAYTPT